MAPDENDKKDLELEELSAINPSENTKSDDDFVDLDVDVSPGAPADDAVEFSARSSFEEDDFDQDMDIDITGDEAIDFADEPELDEGGKSLKKVLAPALVLVIAAGVGGYIVMNPQILGRGAGVPGADVAYVAPSPDTFSTSAPDSFASEGLPQPTVNQNEIPRGPEAPAKSSGFAAFDDVTEPDLTDVSEVSDSSDSAFDLTEAPELSDVSEDIEVTEAVEPPPLSGEATPPAVVAFEADDALSQGSRAGDLTPMEDDAAAKLQASEPAAAADSFELAQAEVVEAPVARRPAEVLEQPAAPAPKESASKPAPVQPSPATAGQVGAASDTFYEGVIPKGPMAEVGPRKVDPTLEPASQFVVVKKSADATDLEATLVAANRALQLKRYESALELFDALYNKNPRDPRILMGRAVAQQNSGLTESAIRTYEQLLEIDPKNANATLNMLGLLRSQYPSVALRRLMDLYEKNPDNAGIAAQIGVTEADLNNYQEALRYLGIAASLEPRNAQHFFNMGIIADRGGDVAKAIEYYQQALQLDAVYSSGRSIPRESVYNRLAALRRR